MKMLKIKKPNTLIKKVFVRNGKYCAVGWLARVIGVSDTTLSSTYFCTLAHTIINRLHTDYSVEISEDEIRELLASNDLLEYSKDRIENFIRWCESKGITVD